MASIKFGLVVTDARGKLGGHVFTKGRSGNTLRTKGIPSNPQTAAQQAVRASLGALSAQWRTLTPAQRESWTSSVESFMKTNVFGDSYAPSGKNLFVSLNTNLVTISAAAITEAPLPSEMQAVNVTSIAPNAGTNSFDFAWSGSNGNQTMAIYATPPLSAGISYAKNQYRLIDVRPQGDLPPVDLASSYVAKFGPMVAGQKIFVKVVPIVDATGQAGVIETISAITL